MTIQELVNMLQDYPPNMMVGIFDIPNSQEVDIENINWMDDMIYIFIK